MRRKSERTATKKTKSPEKKIEKVKRTRTRRRKQSTSSENDSAEETGPVQNEEVVAEVEKKPPVTPVKEDSPEEAHDQVWHVKATEASGDVGEIQKLKICLTRPPSTPERVDRSPRSKRKHSRATSSSDTPSNEGEERKKSKHRSKRSMRGSKDESEKNHDSQEEPEVETESRHSRDKSDNEISQSSDKKSESVPDDTPMSTTNEEAKSSDSVDKSKESANKDKSETSKTSDADTTVASPKVETTVVSTEIEMTDDKVTKSAEDKNVEHSKDHSEDRSEVLELHDEDNRCESLDTDVNKSQIEGSKQEKNSEGTKQKQDLVITKHKKTEDPKCERKSEERKNERMSGDSKQEKKSEDSKQEKKSESSKSENKKEDTKEDEKSQDTRDDKKTEDTKGDKQQDMEQEEKTNVDEVSKTEGKTEDKTDNLSKEKPCDSNEVHKSSDESHVVESSEKNDKVRKVSQSGKEAEESRETHKKERTYSTNSQPEDNTQNGSSAPIVISRKRRWGSRPTKIQTQKSITISTDVLKDIIPDVKPVEFDEVIEDKKSKREVSEKIERPVLPKIVIDNTERIEQNKKATEDKERDHVKPRDHLTSNRKISIVKENDSIITRPPSPPRHKQSCILFITNLVRPFTLPQLKNLLQRTGRIAEDGFWIDRIKSKCYVKYETEDQAIETRHALHGVTWPVSNPKTLQVDFSTDEAFDKAKLNEDTDTAPVSTIPGTVEDWLREQDMKRERGELEKPYERKTVMREWDVGKNEKDKDKIRRHDDRPVGIEKRRHRTPERSPEPARKFKKKEEEAPAKLLDDLFRKTKTTPCIYWLPLSAETIAIKEEQRRQHMAEHERRLQELRRTHRRH